MRIFVGSGPCHLPSREFVSAIAHVPLGSEARPLAVAIVGAGPAGFFAADALIKQSDVAVRVDIFNRLPTPYGLVRDGVAPDHQEIKAVTRAFDRVAADPRVRYFGNVTFGRDIHRDELRKLYHQVVYAVGAPTDRRMGIPGEDLDGSLPATAFVGWYNGLPDYADLDPDLSGERAVVVGNGNVAVDVARMLVKSVDALARTDMALHAVEAFRESRVKEVVVLGRRGPAQAAFTTPELRELGALEGVDVVVDPEDLELDGASRAYVEGDRTAGRNMERLEEFAARTPNPENHRLVLRFLTSPVEILGDGEGRVSAARVERNELVQTEDGSMRPRGSGRFDTIACSLVLRSVGYRCAPLPGVPFDEGRAVLANEGGRVTDGARGPVLPGEYVVGWAKRGPSGVIGTNKSDARDTVLRMLEDLPALDASGADAAPPDGVERTLDQRDVVVVRWPDWERLDAVERARGEALDRPRVKCCTVAEMLEAIEGS
jgi:ferredoxin--NADP+ reductase